MLHLPYWFSPTTADRQPAAWLLRGVMVTRVTLNGVAATLLLWDSNDTDVATSILSGSGARVGWRLLAVSAALHALSFLHHRVHAALSGPPPLHAGLYTVAHVSILNFALDTPGRRIPSVAVSHYLVVIGTLVVGVYLLYVHLTLAPLRRAWGCYDPAHAVGIEGYIHGTCDTPGICALPGINCDVQADPISAARQHAEQAMAALAVVQIMSVPAKLAHYRQATARAVERARAPQTATAPRTNNKS